MITFSLIIPTISRPTLARTLLSLENQEWIYGDEILIVGDGPNPQARNFLKQFKLPFKYLETETKLGYWGHEIRNWINEKEIAKGSYLLNLDDDDVYLPNTIKNIRRILLENPTNIPHIFKMEFQHDKNIIWKDKELKYGNVGTPMFVVPNIKEKLGKWENYHGGDLAFIKETLAKYNNEIIWREEVIANIWPAAVYDK